MNLEKLLGELTEIQKIIIYSSIVALGIIISGIILFLIFNSLTVLIFSILISVFSIVLPFFLFKYKHFLELRDCEKNLPVFLDDLKEVKKSGISFPEAIRNCRGDYGKLNKYINKLKKDISWGININIALQHMQKSLSSSKIISRSIATLRETYLSGGNIEGILNTLISSLLKIMESEEYKKSLMQQHVFLMYGIFLMYIGLIIVLGNFLIPMFTEIGSGQEAEIGIQVMKAESPCLTCNEPSCNIICSYYNTIGSAFNFGESNSLETYYKSLFFTMIVIQGFFTGIIAGQISAKSWVDGAKHGLIMFFLGLIIVITANSIGLF